MTAVGQQIAVLEALERCEDKDLTLDGATFDGRAPLSLLVELTGIPIGLVEQRVRELVALDELLEGPCGYYGRNVLVVE